MIPAWTAWLCALWLPFAYVLPSPRVIEQIDKARSAKTPVSVRFALEGVDPTWPAEVRIDLHPVGGLRLDDQQGGRWVVRRGRVVAGSGSEVPAWIPQIEFLLQPSADTLSSWLEGAGVDLRRNALGRCAADDCFVLGGRDGAAQLWVDKDAFQPRIWVSPAGRRFELTDYRSWGKIKFPNKINILDDSGRIASLLTLRVEPAPQLGADDFSARWTRL